MNRKWNMNKGILLTLVLLLSISFLAGCFNKESAVSTDTASSLLGVGNEKVSFSGVVLDEDGKPIKNLTVLILNENVQAKTNVQGKFNFGGIPGGKQVLQLIGEEGVGQVAVELTRKMQPLTLTYPVITEIVILHDNDSHAMIDNFGKLAGVANQIRTEYENVFLLSGGDIFSGNPVVDQYDPKGKPMIDLMNAAGYDALALGNHDFDYGQASLKDMMNYAAFPMLSANTAVVNSILPQPQPYIILKTKNALEVAVLGLIQVSSTSKIPATSPSKVVGLEFSDPVETAQNYKHLGNKNLFIGLSHLGNSFDHDLAETMPEMDLIIGAHSHTVINTPYLVNGVMIAQAGSKNNSLGKIVVTLKNGQVTDRRGELINLNDAAEVDPAVQSMVDEYTSNNILDQVIGTAPAAINGKEGLGNLMTEAIVAVHNLDMAFQNNGGIRINSLSGDITLNDIYQLEPFANEVIIYEMTTEEIKELLTYSVRYQSIDLQAAGLKYIVSYKNDIINKIILTDYNGTLLDENRTYLVGLNNFVAEKYISFTEKGISTYATVADTIIEYIKDGGSLQISSEGRGSITSEAIAMTDVVLTTGAVSADRYESSNTAGNLMADAIRAATNADFATFPGSNLVTNRTIAVGPVSEASLRSLYNSYISSNYAVVAELTGNDIKDFLLARSKRYNNVDVQVSGLHYDIYLDSLGKAVAVDCRMDDGSEIFDDEVYTITMNSYSFTSYGLADKVLSQYTTAESEQEMLLSYVVGLTEPIPASLADLRVTIIR